MMGFAEFVAQRYPRSDLTEGWLRIGAVTLAAGQSRTAGDTAERAFKAGQQALPQGRGEDTADQRLQRLEAALQHLFSGLIALRQQIGSSVALDLSGHLLAAQTGKALLKRK